MLGKLVAYQIAAVARTGLWRSDAMIAANLSELALADKGAGGSHLQAWKGSLAGTEPRQPNRRYETLA